MRVMTAADVMTRDVVTARPQTSYQEIVEILVGHGISAVPVVDERGGVLGVVSEADLLHKEEHAEPLHELVAAMVAAGGADVHALRDPTRGGVASALNELAAASEVSIEIIEHDLPVPAAAAATCELFGLDPLHVANEGCLVALVAPNAADAVLAAMRADPAGGRACVIGRAGDGPAGLVTARTLVGSSRIVDMLIGEQLPRIC